MDQSAIQLMELLAHSNAEFVTLVVSLKPSEKPISPFLSHEASCYNKNCLLFLTRGLGKRVVLKAPSRSRFCGIYTIYSYSYQVSDSQQPYR